MRHLIWDRSMQTEATKDHEIQTHLQSAFQLWITDSILTPASGEMGEYFCVRPRGVKTDGGTG